jgi:hypothetical protein
VPVVPPIPFDQARTLNQLLGYVRRIMLARSTVLTQHQRRPGWTTVAETMVGTEGNFLVRP